jgi:uncharacterized protein (DUF1697 family)
MGVVISLLRGINVLANKRIRMEDLREAYETAGMKSVRTHLQSGNVVFTTAARDLTRLATRLDDAFEERFGFRTPTVLRTLPQMNDVIVRNPFHGRTDIHPSKLLVVFARGEISLSCRSTLERIERGQDEIYIGSTEMYIYFPEGMGRTKLFNGSAKAMDVPTTGRNWNTVTKLAAMGAELL